MISGVMVAGGWCYQIVGLGGELWGRKRKGGLSEGMLNGRAHVGDADDE